MRRRCDLFRWFAATFAATSLLSAPFSVGENSSVLPSGAPALDPRLDMMATLLAPGPHASLGAEARTFDRVVGTWDADYSFHAEDGSVTHAKGEVRFGWILDGHALEEGGEFGLVGGFQGPDDQAPLDRFRIAGQDVLHGKTPNSVIVS